MVSGWRKMMKKIPITGANVGIYTSFSQNNGRKNSGAFYSRLPTFECRKKRSRKRPVFGLLGLCAAGNIDPIHGFEISFVITHPTGFRG